MVVLCGAAGLERKMNEVSSEVTIRLQERPGLLRSRMYHSAGLTRARVRVSWRVDCQGRRRWKTRQLPANGMVCREGSGTHDGEGDA